MLDLLRDPLWQILGVFLTMLGIVAAVWIYWLQRQTKELAFGIISSRRLIKASDEVSSRITMQLDGKTVTNLYLIIFALKNSGDQAIVKADFERPLRITFPGGCILSATVTSQFPRNIAAEVESDDHHAQLRPLLLNSGDQVVLQLLVSTTNTEPSVDIRILDIPELSLINTKARLPLFFKSGLPMLIGSWIAVGLYLYIRTPDDSSRLIIIAISCVFVAFGILYGILSRLVEQVGKSGRRYVISET